jgi:Asp-tRNA(Asn)/Glu-tRNA(Gln) amidotransferase A subunit family amidase
MKNARKRLPRREVLKGLAAGAAGSAAVAAAAQEPAPPPITPDDVAAATKLSGRSYGAEERALMARRAPRTRAALEALRSVEVGETVEPAFHFTPRLPGMKLPSGKSGFALTPGETPAYSGDPASLAFATVVQLSRLIRARKVTSAELTRLYLDRLKRFGPRLECVVTLTEELALDQADRADREIAAGKYRGPLHGIPWGAKDILATKSIRTTWGAKPYEHQVFDYDAEVVRRLEAAGAVLLAKLTTGELALGDVWFGGTTRNPWNPEQGSSGSSAGPGSAVAAGLVGFAIGSETHGSIVSPSVRNGVTGLRPTYGRVPRTGAMTLCWTLDKLGPMCRGVEDCAAVLAAIHGPDDRDLSVADVPFRWPPAKKLSAVRLGMDASAFQGERNAERREIQQQALEVLRRLGFDPVPVKLPSLPAYRSLVGTIIDVESAAAFSRLTESGQVSLLARQGEGSWPNTFRLGATVPAVDYIQAQRVRRRLQQEVAEALKEVDVYVTVPFAGLTMPYTNLTGHPSLVTRCGVRGGQPESIEFIGSLYGEADLLRVGLAFERATPWHNLTPAVERLALP